MSLRASQSHKRKKDVTQGECSPSMRKAPASISTTVLILDGIQVEDKTGRLHGTPRGRCALSFLLALHVASSART